MAERAQLAAENSLCMVALGMQLIVGTQRVPRRRPRIVTGNNPQCERTIPTSLSHVVPHHSPLHCESMLITTANAKAEIRAPEERREEMAMRFFVEDVFAWPLT